MEKDMQKPQSSQGAFENLKPVTIPFEEGVLETLKAGDLIGLTGVLLPAGIRHTGDLLPCWKRAKNCRSI